jgi:hypothetical protein
MKKILQFAWLLFALGACAQVPSYNNIFDKVPTAPSGACGTPAPQNTFPSGQIWVCANGTWTLYGSGPGSGISGSGTVNTIPTFTPNTTTLGSSALTSCTSGGLQVGSATLGTCTSDPGAGGIYASGNLLGLNLYTSQFNPYWLNVAACGGSALGYPAAPSWCSGSDVGAWLNACTAYIKTNSAWGGTCDATGLGQAAQSPAISGQPAWTTPIVFGQAATTNVQTNWINYLLPLGSWTWTGGTTSGCMAQEDEFATVLGPSSGEDIGFLFLALSGSATSIFCTNPSPASGGEFAYKIAQGFGAKSGPSVSLSGPVMLLQQTADHSLFRNLMGLSHTANIAFEMTNLNDGTIVENSGGETYATSGAQPCVIIEPMVETNIKALNCVHSGATIPNLTITLGNFTPWPFTIDGFYSEFSATGDTTTPDILIQTSGNSTTNPGPTFQGSVILGEDNTGSTRYVIQTDSSSSFNVTGVIQNSHYGYVIDDVKNGVTIVGASPTTTPYSATYHESPTYVQALNILGACQGCVGSTVPPWLLYLASGADGSNTNASGNLSGEHFYTTFTVPFGNTVTVNSNFGLTIHATGTCTIAGTITSAGQTTSSGLYGGTSGGSGGGTSAGSAGGSSYISVALTGATAVAAGSAGAASGGNGGNGGTPATSPIQRLGVINQLGGSDGVYASGAVGAAGANSGGARGNAGGGITLICQSITGTDGTHTGIIDAEGATGSPSAANSTGAGSGGGGAPVVLSSLQAVTIWPTVYIGGGAGGVATVPEAAPLSLNACSTTPIVTCGVTAGVLSGGTVAVAGAGCGTSPAINWTILGGGGTGGTITPTWSGGALTAAACSGGSGYTATIYTTSGSGGQGGAGWYAEFANGTQVH